MVVGGPHESSDGRAVTIDEREIGILQIEGLMMLVTWCMRFKSKSSWILRLITGQISPLSMVYKSP